MSYVPTQDRLLFRMNTKARQEFRFWMTRRYVSILWNTLMKLVNEAKPEEKDRVAAANALKDSIAETAKAEIEHKEKVAKSDFETAYEESTYLPLGEEPSLLFSVGVKPNPQGQAMICMHPENGQGIEMVLNDQIMHSLCKLLIDTTKKANWDLNLVFAPPKDGPKPDEEPPQGLN